MEKGLVMWTKIFYLLSITTLFFIGCSQQQPNINSNMVEISGKITYDRVPVAIESGGVARLDYNNIKKIPSKNILVKAIDKDGKVISQTTTNRRGQYTLFVPSDSLVKIRAYAKMYKEKYWDVAVVDNTNNKAMYVIDGEYHNVRDKKNIRNLHASSGWHENGYTSPRIAAPFAILDSIDQAMEKVRRVDKSAKFPQLTVNWSVHNIAAAGDVNSGQIITSNYDGERNLWILGDADSDTDEYDDHIIIHEWGHYFEANFSRADSIGGSHGDGDKLDIRVAFGEGWGNAWSAIVTDNPIYYDTMGRKQSNGFSMNIESEFTQNPGWYSEDSIQKILYDLYDSHNDGGDTLSLGFKPIYDVLVGSQKTTPAFTSIFSFITYLKENNPSAINKIDDILANENIESIQNIYGSTIDSDLYSDMSNGSINICTYSQYGRGNKLYNHRYIRFSISQNGNYTVRVKQSDGSNSDPDFSLYKTAPFINMGASEESVFGVESHSYSLSSDDYLLDISDYNNLRRACFDITVN